MKAQQALLLSLVCAFPALALAQGASQPAATPSVTLEATEVPLGDVPRGMKCGSLAVSPDGQRLAYAVGKAGFTSGKVSIFVDAAMLQPDGSRPALTRGPAYDGVRAPVFSADGQDMAYAALNRSTGQTLVTSAGAGAFYERVGLPVFSPDGHHIAYAAGRGTRSFVVLDGVEGDAYEEVTSPSFSPDGQRVAHGARRGGEIFLVVNGARIDEGPGAEMHSPVFSPDGRLAYSAKQAGVSTLVIEGAPPRPHPEFKELGDPVFSPDGQHVAYWAFDGDKDRILLDEVAGKVYDVVGTPLFSPDGRHLAFVAKPAHEWKWCLVVDGVEGPTYDPGFVSRKRELHQAGRRDWVFEAPDRLVAWGQPLKSPSRLLEDGLKLSMTEPSLCGPIVRREVRIVEAVQSRALP